jgi:hypothetical protein
MSTTPVRHAFRLAALSRAVSGGATVDYANSRSVDDVRQQCSSYGSTVMRRSMWSLLPLMILAFSLVISCSGSEQATLWLINDTDQTITVQTFSQTHTLTPGGALSVATGIRPGGVDEFPAFVNGTPTMITVPLDGLEPYLVAPREYRLPLSAFLFASP